MSLRGSYGPIDSKVIGLACASLVHLTASAAPPETTYESKDLEARKGSQITRTQIDEVDTQSGNLLVRHTDLLLKGNAGFDLMVQRNYTLNAAAASAQMMTAHAQGYRSTEHGPGWTMLVAPRWMEAKYPLANGSAAAAQPDLVTLCSGQASRSNPFSTIAPVVELPNGSREQLVLIGGGVAISKGNWRAECSGENLTIKSPQGIRYEFGSIYQARGFGDDALGPMSMAIILQPTRAVDSYGNWISYRYREDCGSTLNGRGGWDDDRFVRAPYDARKNCSPLQITASDGRQVTFTYDGASKLSSMSDSAGRVWQYEHSADDSQNTSSLTGVTLPNGQRWGYTYTPGPLSVSTGVDKARNRKLHSITYPEGGVVTYELAPFYSTWSESGPGYSFTRTFGIERVASRSLSSGESWTYSYTHGERGHYDSSTVVDPNGERTVYWYMGTKYALPVYPINGNTFPYTENVWQFGRLMEKWDSSGIRERYKWQQREVAAFDAYLEGPEPGRDSKVWAADLAEKIVYRDGDEYKTTFSNYDSYGNARSMVETGPNGGSRSTTSTFYNDTAKWIIGKVKDVSHAGMAITRSYNANGSVATETLDGATTSFEYDGGGNLVRTTFPRGVVQTFGGHKMGLPQTETRGGITVQRVVDSAGNISSETNGRGKTTSYTYDGTGRITSVATPAGNRKTTSYSTRGKETVRGALVESTEYDGFGRTIAVTLGGIRTSYGYDALGRKNFESNPGASGGTATVYDVHGRLTRQTNADGSSRTVAYGGNQTVATTDERGNVTSRSYRSYGNPEERFLMTVGAPEAAASVTLERNARDQVTAVTQGGIRRTYGYNAAYQLVTATEPETGTVSYGRDAAGNMTSRTIGGVSTGYVYDDLDRLTGINYAAGTSAVALSYSPTNKLLRVSSSVASRDYSYDDNDNLTGETVTVDGLSFALGYGYNANDQLQSLTYPRSGRRLDFQPDVLGRPTQVAGYANSVQYWPSGQVAQIDYANGTVSTYGQNARLWPATFATQRGGAVLQSSSYDYDGIGNLNRIYGSANAAYNRSMSYDRIDRLVGISGPWGEGALAYDGSGNLSSQSFGSFNVLYNYDGANRLRNVSGSRAVAYGYDAGGNAISGGADAYSYDGAGNLRCVNCSVVARKIEYGYDGRNQRVWAMRNGVKTYEVYGSHGNLLMEYTPGQPGKLLEYYYLGGKRIAQRLSQ
ncbi:hypothetical protein [Massilia sp. erpn]|uniref:hypothetical protein n=1 Tax=Massilia sp. erpn TaxID=2738142 RepID=UPI002107FAF1|nr:hypothetical protein [Massilia sp. erpn]UTY55836.1 RHS repeat protein [Massilia sp. erpn]